MSPTLMPHAVCWNQDQALIWTMAITNAITFLSYLSICFTLFYLTRKTRGSVRRNWAFFLVGFGLFIVACGTTHLLEVITTWIPIFWVDAWTNIITAVLSAYVAIQFGRKAAELGFGVNDYATRLANAENERARIQESLVAARKLDEWNKMSAVITHEINNPLAAIGNLLFLMQMMPGITPEIAGLAGQCTEELRRIESLTRSTLGFFRQGKEPELVDLAASAEAVRFLLGPTLRQRGIEFEMKQTGDTKVTAYAVETRQVLLNLVRNACEATDRREAKVTVSLEGLADEVRIAVTDKGTGISPEIRSKLFEFGVSSKGESGNGMGLWLVRQLVVRHGGSIEVASTPGEGTTFTILWPRTIAVQSADDQTFPAGAGVPA